MMTNTSAANAACGHDVEDRDFDESGSWRVPVAPWPRPEQAFASDGFARVLVDLVDDLPPAQARAFAMREWQRLETSVICGRMGISERRLDLLLHRARVTLCRGLQKRWFRSA